MFRRKKKEAAIEATPESQAPIEESLMAPVEEAAATTPVPDETSAVEGVRPAESVSSSAEAEATSDATSPITKGRSEEHTSELQSQSNLVCRLLLEKKKHPHSNAAHAVLRVPSHGKHSHLASLLPRSLETSA